MLVLSRKNGERIHIGDGIELQVIAVRGSRVTLGITCPREIPIVRSEHTERSPDHVIDFAEPVRHLHNIAG
jgi:carbon storage regulator CsrA